MYIYVYMYTLQVLLDKGTMGRLDAQLASEGFDVDALIKSHTAQVCMFTYMCIHMYIHMYIYI